MTIGLQTMGGLVAKGLADKCREVPGAGGLGMPRNILFYNVSHVIRCGGVPGGVPGVVPGGVPGRRGLRRRPPEARDRPSVLIRVHLWLKRCLAPRLAGRRVSGAADGVGYRSDRLRLADSTST